MQDSVRTLRSLSGHRDKLRQGDHTRRRQWLLLEALEERRLLASDFGDAPAPYPTLVDDNGAAHESIGPTLGEDRDTEDDGQPTATADGDDSDDTDDEDGVTFGSIMVGQLDAVVTVNVQGAPDGARLDAWIDFNGDGSWGGPADHVFDNLAVNQGQTVLQFDVPSWSLPGQTYARFRLSSIGDLPMGGMASDGEVEDYQLTIAPPVAASGLFGDQNIISSTAEGAISVFAADADGDGDMDVFSASAHDDKIAWYENDGNQNFAEHVIWRNAIRPIQIFVTDVDGDGDVDVLSTSGADDNIAWYKNDGDGNFHHFFVNDDLRGPGHVFSADIDNDGDMDILSAFITDDRVAWYQNDGNQNFSRQSLNMPPLHEAWTVYAADLDSDSDVDIISASRDTNRVVWYENQGGGDFAENITSTEIDGAIDLVASDLDGDRDADLVVAFEEGDTIAWYENDRGLFRENILTTNVDASYCVFAADVDGDGDMDVLGSSYNNDTVAWYENGENQTFTEHVISTSADMVRSVFLADIDGDGDLDAISASDGDDKIAWYEHNATPSFNAIADLVLDENAGLQTVHLTGISAGVGEDQPLAVTASSDKTDLIEDPAVTYTSAEEAATLAFTPLPDQHGTAAITVTVEDGGLDADLETTNDNATTSQTFTVTIRPGNDPPVAVGDTYAVEENNTLNSDSPGVLDNDSDPDGDALTAVLIDDASHGTLSLKADGGFSYTPDDNFNRTDSFTYRAEDASEASETATVTITVTTEFPWHNGLLALDVNDDGSIAPNDAILGVSSINRDGSRELSADREAGIAAPFYDTNRDGSHAPNDIILVVNYLNSGTSGAGEAAIDGSDLYWNTETPLPPWILTRPAPTAADAFADEVAWDAVRPTASVRSSLYDAAQLNSPLASWGTFVDALDALLAEQGESLPGALAVN